MYVHTACTVYHSVYIRTCTVPYEVSTQDGQRCYCCLQFIVGKQTNQGNWFSTHTASNSVTRKQIHLFVCQLCLCLTLIHTHTNKYYKYLCTNIRMYVCTYVRMYVHMYECMNIFGGKCTFCTYRHKYI